MNDTYMSGPVGEHWGIEYNIEPPDKSVGLMTPAIVDLTVRDRYGTDITDQLDEYELDLIYNQIWKEQDA